MKNDEDSARRIRLLTMKIHPGARGLPDIISLISPPVLERADDEGRENPARACGIPLSL